jgi:hypothetical protein
MSMTQERRMRSTLVIVVLTVLLGAGARSAGESLLRIEVTPNVSQAPALVRIRVHVTPSAANRGLRIVAESGDFFRSSYVALDGAEAAPITEASFKNLPGGDYEVTVSLVDAGGHTTSIDRRFIMVTSPPR